jgi:DNA-directed RNA polymerase subunit beta
MAEDVVNPQTGEVMLAKGEKATREIADKIQDAAVPYVYVHRRKGC